MYHILCVVAFTQSMGLNSVLSSISNDDEGYNDDIHYSFQLPWNAYKKMRWCTVSEVANTGLLSKHYEGDYFNLSQIYHPGETQVCVRKQSGEKRLVIGWSLFTDIVCVMKQQRKEAGYWLAISCSGKSCGEERQIMGWVLLASMNCSRKNCGEERGRVSWIKFSSWYEHHTSYPHGVFDGNNEWISL